MEFVAEYKIDKRHPDVDYDYFTLGIEADTYESGLEKAKKELLKYNIDDILPEWYNITIRAVDCIKFEVTKDYKFEDAEKVYRIKAYTRFSDVNKGDLGGFVAKDKNLTHYDECWIYNDAIAKGNSRVEGNAILVDNVVISGNVIVADEAQLSGSIIADCDVMVCGNGFVDGCHYLTGNTFIDDVYDLDVLC